MATHLMYGNAIKAAFNKEIDWDSDTIKAALLLNTYVPSQDNHDYWDDVVAFEHANANGYTSGGVVLGSKTAAYTGGTNIFQLGAGDAIWTASGGSIVARYCVVYDDTPGTAATKPLISVVDFGSDQTAVAGQNMNVVWSVANGLYQVTVG